MAVAVVQCVVTANAAPAGTSVTSSWTPAAGNQYLMFAGIRGGGAPSNFVTGVSGNGLTWVKIADVDDTQNVIAGTLWKGTGTPSAGAVTLTHGLGPISLSIQLIELSGADSTLGAVATANVGATDDNAPTVDLTTTGANSMVLGLIIGRSATLTVGSGYTAIQINQTASSSGNISRSSSEYKIVASPGLTTVNASLSGANDWAIIAVEVLEASTGVNGTLSKTLGALTAVSTGAVALAGVTAQTLAPATAASTGALAITGTAVKTLSWATVASTGAVGIAGTAGATLGALTVVAALSIETHGVVTITLGGLVVAAPGTVAITGALAKTLGVLTAAGAGTLPLAGAAGTTLGALTLVAAGELASGNQGALTIVLDAVTVAGAGTLGIHGDLDTALDGVSVAGAGALGLAASAGLQLGALIVAATGEGPGAGAVVAATLAPLEIEADGALTIGGALAITLGGMVAIGAGTVAHNAALSATLGALTLQATGTVTDGYTGNSAIVLGALTLNATGAFVVAVMMVRGTVRGPGQRGSVMGPSNRGRI